MENNNRKDTNVNEDLVQQENENLIPETENETEEQEAQGYVAQFDDIEGLTDDYTVTVTEPEKKKFFIFRYINPSIFVAICVFLAALLAFGAYYIFGAKTITGTWIYTIENQTASPDEVDSVEQYYVFESADSNGSGKLYTYYDGAEQSSDYTVTSDGDKKILNLGNSEFTYEIEGIKLFGNATLKLTMPGQTDPTTGQTTEEQTIELVQGKSPDYEDQSMDNYNTDDKLIGTWEADRSSLYYGYYLVEYTEKITIMDSGVLKISYENEELGLSNAVYYAYTVKNGKLTIQRVTSDDKDTVEYTVKDGKLTFVDKTANSMFYDQVFGDVTYYTEGNKPKETQTETTNAKETTTAEDTTKNTKADK